MLSLWSPATALEIGPAPPVAEGKCYIGLRKKRKEWLQCHESLPSYACFILGLFSFFA